jgi:1-acyl-sn-glycerol-3-phosphate acyltransferase
MEKDTYSIKYPRRVGLRKGLLTIGRLLIDLLAQVDIIHEARLPTKGPIILAGNHVAALEAVLMAVYSPGLVEFIGNGDIPFDPNYEFIVKAYGFIPINRGNLDRKGLQMGLDVLKQDGILGIFPEGGIWDPNHMQAQIGAAWLSYKAQAPILPIGFGGVSDGLKQALRLQHPKLLINVGPLMPPVSYLDDRLPLKDNLEKAASEILTAINQLVPESKVHQFQHRIDEFYQLEIEVHESRTQVKLPNDLKIEHGAAYAHFLFNPTMLDVFIRNLHLPLKPLKMIYRQTKLDLFLAAWESILTYLEVNPGYFTYRFGMDEGLAVKKALEELVKLGTWAQQSGYALTITPIRRYRNPKTDALVVEHGGCFPQSMGS